jgi:hypothetical protein
MGVLPDAVWTAQLLVHEQSMRVPSCIGMGWGVSIRKRGSGGVMRSRLAGSAKKANACSRGSGTLMDVLRTRSATLLIVNCGVLGGALVFASGILIGSA